MALVKNNENTSLVPTSFDALLKTFQTCHDIVWEGGKRDPMTAFDEFSKILMTKLYDENRARRGVGDFYIREDERVRDVARRIKNLYKQIRAANPDIFRTDISLSDRNIYDIVKTIQGISFSLTDLDVKGRAFENFLGKVLRDDYGQYFTPRNIVQFMIDLMAPNKRDVILDPACGSGGFLINSMMYVFGNETIEMATRRERMSAFADKHIFGIEVNDKIARIAMMDMIVHGDGHKNIHCNNALIDLDGLGHEIGVHESGFSLILTNPPFGANVSDSEILAGFELGHNKESQKTEVLFIERCLHFLKEGGRLGIVLPDSILTNATLQYVRDFILEKARILAIISLPPHTFLSSGAGVKPSLVFLEKGYIKEDYDVFMASATHIGYDSRGKEDENDLDDILTDWNRYIVHKERGGRHTYISKASTIRHSFSPDTYNSKKSERVGIGYALSDLCDGIVFAGTTPPRNEYTATGHKIIKVRDLTGKGIDWDNKERAFISPAFFTKHQKKELRVNDILLITAAHHKKYIGLEVDIIDSIPERYSNGVVCSAEIMVIRVNPDYIDPFIVYLYLRSQEGYDVIQSCVRGQTAHIYPKDIKNIIIPEYAISKLKGQNNTIEKLKKALRTKTRADEEIHSIFDTTSLTCEH